MSAAGFLRIEKLTLDDPIAPDQHGYLLQLPQDLRLGRRCGGRLWQQLQDLRESHDFGVGEEGEKSVGGVEVLQLGQGKHVRWHRRRNLVNIEIKGKIKVSYKHGMSHMSHMTW